MKSNLSLAILLLFLSLSYSYSQQYGWTNIGGNLPSGTGTSSMSDFYFVSANEGWICSSALGEIYHTTDGGQTFTTQTTQYYTNAIHMLSSSEGYAGGYNGRVYRTTDGGATWNVLGSVGSSLLSLSFPPSSTTGYCCGDKGTIYTINSSGVSAMSSGVSSSLRSISFPSSGLGWTCGGFIILNYDGLTWNEQDSPLGSSYNGIYMVNSNTGFAVGASGLIVATSNGGIGWTKQTSPTTASLNDVFFLNASEGWAVGNSGVILHTTNGGSDWSIEGSGLTTNMLRAVQFTSSTNGYILGNNGTLLKYNQTTGIENIDGQNRNTKLVQNYPNPFNSTTLLKYTLHEPGNVRLAVYNQQGQMISLMVNEYQLAGKHTATFNGSDLPSGVYYIRINTADKCETGKMMLIK